MQELSMSEGKLERPGHFINRVGFGIAWSGSAQPRNFCLGSGGLLDGFQILGIGIFLVGPRGIGLDLTLIHSYCSVFWSLADILATPWAVACQAPLSVGFLGQEYWGGLPCPTSGDLSDPGTEPASPACQAGSLPLSHQGSPNYS